MLSTRFVDCARRAVLPFRALSTCSASRSEALVTVNKSGPVATLTLDRAPANSLSLELIHSIHGALHDIENDGTTRGLIISSSNPKIFCAGLEFDELEDPDPARLVEFWTSLQTMCADLFETRLATVCAMEGHAPAGGCVLALSTDYRVMSSAKVMTGLNEVQVSPAVPFVFYSRLWYSTAFVDSYAVDL